MLVPPALTSCNRTVPSLPVNSTMTRHFIPLPRSAVITPTHTTPRFETVSRQGPLRPLEGREEARLVGQALATLEDFLQRRAKILNLVLTMYTWHIVLIREDNPWPLQPKAGPSGSICA
jgi:hypothetical protein